MINALIGNEAEILPRPASARVRKSQASSSLNPSSPLSFFILIDAALLDVLVLGRDQRQYREQIAGGFPGTQNHVPDAADEGLYDVLDSVQPFLGAQSCRQMSERGQ